MTEKPKLILITVSCQLPDGQIVRADRMIERYKIESANYTTDVLGYNALQAFKDLDKLLEKRMVIENV